MPSPSADRPPAPPQKLFSEDDVAMLVQVAGARLLAMTGLTEIPASRALLMSHEMRAVLTALATAGRLLPVDAEHDEEFAVVGALPDGTPWASDPHYRLGDARQLAAMMAPGAVIKRRLINAGPWVDVDGSVG